MYIWHSLVSSLVKKCKFIAASLYQYVCFCYGLPANISLSLFTLILVTVKMSYFTNTVYSNQYRLCLGQISQTPLRNGLIDLLWRNFIKFLKRCPWQILNILGLLVNFFNSVSFCHLVYVYLYIKRGSEIWSQEVSQHDKSCPAVIWALRTDVNTRYEKA